MCNIRSNTNHFIFNKLFFITIALLNCANTFTQCSVSIFKNSNLRRKLI